MGTDALGEWRERRAAGKRLRETAAREAHGEWAPAADRPDPLETIAATNAGRQPRYAALRYGRMAESPFSFLRGAAAVMAWDLSRGPQCGLDTGICGDAHVMNFGLFGNAERNVTLDVNDFDEARNGPWEWDVKRLSASIELATAEVGLKPRERSAAVERCARGYREYAVRYQGLGALDLWYENAFPGCGAPLDRRDSAYIAQLDKALVRARSQTSLVAMEKLCERGSRGAWRLRRQPPVLGRVDASTREAVTESLKDYIETLPRERRAMVRRYRVADVGYRIGGVGSVGVRNYVVLLFGAGAEDPLMLQVKEALPPAGAPGLPELPPDFVEHPGRRVVYFQRLMQASGDILLGWTRIDDRPFYVRQLRNMKGGLPFEKLGAGGWQRYAFTCGALLARAHARSGDIAAIAGYCGGSTVFDEAMARFASAYADQTRRDHAELLRAIASKKVKAVRTG